MRNFVSYQQSTPVRVWNDLSTWSSNYSAAAIAACKSLCQSLLTLAPALEAVSEASDGYYLRVRGHQVGFYIRAYQLSLYVQPGVYDGQDAFTAYVPSSSGADYVNSFFGYYYGYSSSSESWIPYVKVTVIGDGNTLANFVFQSSYTGSTIGSGYGVFTSSGRSGATAAVRVTFKASASYDSTPGTSFSPDGLTTGLIVRNPDNGGCTPLYDDGVGYSRGTPYGLYFDYALLPICANLSGGTKALTFLNVRWGGDFVLYQLFSDSNVNTLAGYKVTAGKNETVTVNGIQLTACGWVFAAG